MQLTRLRNGKRVPITSAKPFRVGRRHGGDVVVAVRLDRTALAKFKASGDRLAATAVMRYASGYGRPGSTTFSWLVLR